MKFPSYFNFLVFKTLGIIFLLSAFAVLAFVSITHFNNVDKTKPVLSTQGTVISDVYKFDGTSFVSVELEDGKIIPLAAPSNDYKVNQEIEVFYTLETSSASSGALRGKSQTDNISYSMEIINPSQGKSFGFYGYSFLVAIFLSFLSSVFFYAAHLYNKKVQVDFTSTHFHSARLSARRRDDKVLSTSKAMNWNAIIAAYVFTPVVFLPTYSTNGFELALLLISIVICIPVLIVLLILNSKLEILGRWLYAKAKYSPIGKVLAKEIYWRDDSAKKAYKYVKEATNLPNLTPRTLDETAHTFDGTVDELIQQLNSKQVALATV